MRRVGAQGQAPVAIVCAVVEFVDGQRAVGKVRVAAGHTVKPGRFAHRVANATQQVAVEGELAVHRARAARAKGKGQAFVHLDHGRTVALGAVAGRLVDRRQPFDGGRCGALQAVGAVVAEAIDHTVVPHSAEVCRTLGQGGVQVELAGLKVTGGVKGIHRPLQLAGVQRRAGNAGVHKAGPGGVAAAAQPPGRLAATILLATEHKLAHGDTQVFDKRHLRAAGQVHVPGDEDQLHALPALACGVYLGAAGDGGLRGRRQAGHQQCRQQRRRQRRQQGTYP